MRYNASPFDGLPVVVKNLLIINGIFFIVMITGLGNFGGTDMDSWFGLHYFSSPLFKPWQLVTHMFMHAGPDGSRTWIFHIIFNMFGLFMFGPPLEYKWGSKRFLAYYLVVGVGAALLYSGVHTLEYYSAASQLSAEELEYARNGRVLDPQNYANAYQVYKILHGNLIGASGAISGLLLAFGMTYPNVELMVFPLPFPVKAKYLVLSMAGLSIYLALRNNPGDNVAHLAHLGGMVVGFILIRLWRNRGDNGFGWGR
ncbi:MAG: rhomboid family intramembrane serine protease [Flavobacteriales bacterium]|nr:rhomboid family intramembrane serine protease [Flavobacteriales bacterium]